MYRRFSLRRGRLESGAQREACNRLTKPSMMETANDETVKTSMVEPRDRLPPPELGSQSKVRRTPQDDSEHTSVRTVNVESEL